MSELVTQIEAFKENIINSGYVLDPEGTHHEFVSGMHGQKLDFDKIERYSPLYEEWTSVAASFIREEFPKLPEIIIGVANGTNRVALDAACHFEGDVIGMVTRKDQNKKISLNGLASQVILAVQPELVVVLEDVGTSGASSAQAASASLEAGAKHAEVVTTWQRREKLEKLEEADIPYRAIIKEPLPTYSSEDCQDHGFCSQGWEFIEREK